MIVLKIIAFYLPQFHRIPENDRWWGKGFTEWTNTKKAKPLFYGHYQPREPFNDNYYNLTHPVSRNWQAQIARDYGIYGFCYYHYWFKGKQLLETPINEVLRTGEPDFPFCFSWANEPWTRRWDGNERDVLMPQDYGDEEDWKEHFNYLLKFFQDKRYIRVEDKPVFLIYRPGSIPRCEEMLLYWNHLAQENGLSGIYFINTLNSFPLYNSNGFDASLEFEPSYTVVHSNCGNIRHIVKGYNKRRLSVIDYDVVWKCILNRTVENKGNKTFPGAFIDWDNSARLGYKGTIFTGANPLKFYEYFNEQIKRAISYYDSEFLFINAWNEWAEGTYLEPDKRFGFQYLEAVKNALGNNNCLI